MTFPHVDASSLLMCAGITTFNAIRNRRGTAGRRGRHPRTWGGLGHLGVQYAAKMGFHTVGNSVQARERQSRALACELGAATNISIAKLQDPAAELQKLGAQKLFWRPPLSAATR